MDAHKLKRILLKILASIFLLLICGTVISQGLRSVNAGFAYRLAKIPGLGFLADFSGWHRLDIANVVAVGLLLLEYLVLVTAMRYFLVPGAMQDGDGLNWNPANERTLTWIGFVVLTGLQAFLFFVGILSDESSWDGVGGFVGGLTALAGSLLYMVAMIGVAYFTVRIERS